jgi:glycosyltransferase involved in cell wall biosynthesis
MRILYIYAGRRKGRVGPTTQFYGLTALKRMGFDVSYKEFEDIYGTFLARILPFNLRHVLMYFSARNYDIVFGSALLPSMFLRTFFPSKAAFVLLNISLTRLLTSNRSGFKKRMISYALSKLDAIVCLSRSQAEYLTQHTLFPQQRIYSVRFGVDTHFYSRTKDMNQHFVLSVGRDDGRDYATVCKVAEAMPERHFIIVCSHRNVKGLNIPTNVEVRYNVSHEILRELYRKAHCILILTHGGGYADGADCSGQTVLLESMAVGVPPIVTHNPCLSEYIEKDTNAFIVEPYDVEGVVEKIKKLDSVEIRTSMSNHAEKSIRSQYTEEAMASDLAALFRDLRP